MKGEVCRLTTWMARFAGIAIVAVVAVALVVLAAENGKITGTIRDSAGAAIAGVFVIAEDSPAGIRRETRTDRKGAYTFNNLSAGTYRVTANLAGFQSARYSGVALAAGKTLEYDFRLNAGAATEIAELGSKPLSKESVPAALASAIPPITVELAQTKQNAIVDDGTVTGVSGGVVGGVIGGRLGGVMGGTLGGVFGGSPASPPPPRPAACCLGAATVVVAAPSLGRTVNSEPMGGADNPFVAVSQTQLSTFSVDVDTASYSNVRRFITQNQRPPRDFVRIEELINYFSYDYPVGSGADPITGNIEVAAAPWNTEHRLVRIGVRAKPVDRGQKAANLVFLIDVSGSMAPPERLPLLKSSLRMLVERLTESDTVSIVTYAGAAGVALRPTNGDRKETILKAIDNLGAEGSTNGGAGIQTAYDMAVANFVTGGVNRVILATDGDFNVGVTDQNELVRLIEAKAKSGVFLTVLGVGQNFRDALLEKLADKGNGNFAFLDTLNEARRVLLEQIDATLVTVAKDVKIQVEFNPEHVSAYRLIGYENRMLSASDFNNDVKDAGEMGAGHTVTAFYEVIPRGAGNSIRPGESEPRFEGVGVDPLRYRQVNAPGSPISDEMLNLKIRYKEPEGNASRLIDVPVVDRGATFSKASNDFRFAAAVAAFGMILRDSPHKGAADWSMVRRIASESKGKDRTGYREEFIQLTERVMETAHGWR